MARTKSRCGQNTSSISSLLGHTPQDYQWPCTPLATGRSKWQSTALEKNTNRSLRPRIEHLELASARDAARLGRLGITASIQPVDSDPAILRAWPRLIGHDR
ncbi:hypothetical protein ED733_002017 [Metarhizium rileyi]|uniref:Uncharacterized protein n=1 Tax=Metarhizium rileyi (strain RCEF 4871) TaxID=1649241 RepID=A0A5C6FZN3_METRR|nr:hypothetical protein ED733_002017 [Metarhizium rileyi]